MSEQSSDGSSPTTVIKTSNNDIFDPTDTILVQNTPGYNPDGSESVQDLMLYVMGRDTNGVTVMAVNGRGLRWHI